MVYVVKFFFSIWVFFHELSQFMGQQGKGEGIYLTPFYHFHLLHTHLDISLAIAAESSLPYALLISIFHVSRKCPWELITQGCLK